MNSSDDALTKVEPALQAVRALARVARALDRASGELSLAHYRVLAAIAEGDERASRVAVRLAIGKPTISAAVEALCQRGLIVRASVAGDQRATALSLTIEGQSLLDSVEATMLTWLRDVCDRTPDGARVMQSLSWLGAAIDEVADERFRQTRAVVGAQTDGPKSGANR
ncbi:MarR family winged helix-turn-helix transcriptional regulator [Jatrophihabitans sp. DSM 45814]